MEKKRVKLTENYLHRKELKSPQIGDVVRMQLTDNSTKDWKLL